MSPAEEARLAELRAEFAPQPAAAPPPAGIGMANRLGRHGLNFLPDSAVRAAETILSVPFRLLDLVGVESGNVPSQESGWKPVDIPASQTGGEAVMDVVFGGVAPELPTLLAGGGALRSGARLLGAGPRTAAIAADSAVGLASGARDSGGEALTQAGEFGAGAGIMSALGNRSPVARALLGGVANAGIGVAGQVARGNDITSQEALTQAAVLGSLPIAQEAVGAAGRRLLRKKAAPVEAQAIEVDEVIPPDGPLALPGPVRPAQDRLPRLPWSHGEARTFSPSGEPILADGRRFVPLIADDLATAPEAAGDIFASLTGPRKRASAAEPAILDSPLIVEPTLERQAMANRIAAEQARVAGMTPEQRNALGLLRRREAGAVNPMLLAPIAGGAVGVVANPDDPLMGASVGAAIGAAGSLGARRLLRAKGATKPVPQPSTARPTPVSAEVPVVPESQGSVTPVASVQTSSAVRAAEDAISSDDARRIADLVKAGMSEADAIAGLKLLQSGKSLPRATTLKPLRRNQGSANPMMLAGIGGAGVGALADTDDPVQGALVGAAIAMGGVKGAQLFRSAKLREAADKQMRPNESTALGKVGRFMEKNMNLGKSARLTALDDRARGEAEFWADKMESAMKSAGRMAYGDGLTPTQKAAGEAFIASKGDPVDLASLKRAGVPNEYRQYLETAKDAQKQMQGILMAAESDPRKAALIGKTLGTYQTRQYRYFLDDDFHIDPAKKAAVINEWKSSPVFAGVDPAIVDDVVSRDLDQHLRELRDMGGDYWRAGNEGKSKISRTLYTSRKELTPAYRGLLGEVTDKHEAQVLTANKLLQNVAQSKVVGDLRNASDEAGNRFAMSDQEWQAALSAARASGDKAKADFLLNRYVTAPDSPGLGALSGQKVQRQIADYFQFAGHKGLDTGNGSWYAQLNQIPKAVFTRFNPATWVRNYGQAVLQGHALGIFDPRRIVKTAWRLHKDDALRADLLRSGVLGAHAGRHEFGQNARKLSMSLNKGFKGQMRAVMDAINDGYGKPDQWLRATAYLDELDKNLAKGMARQEAGLKALEFVNRYSHNYGQVNRLVGKARNVPVVNPFISYSSEMARIIKNLAEDVVTGSDRAVQSGVALLSLLAVPSMIVYAAKEFGLDEKQEKELAQIEELLPDYMRGRLNAAFAGADKSIEMFNLQPWMPAGDFVTVARNLLRGDGMALATHNPIASLSGTPAVNFLAEVATGRDLVTQRQNRGMDRIWNPLKKNITPTVAPGGYRYEQFMRSLTPNENGGYGIEEPSGRLLTPGRAIAGTFGFSTSVVEKRRLLKRVDTDIKQQLSEAKREMTDILRTSAAPDVKEAAREEYRETRRRLMRRKQEIFAASR